MAGGDAVDSLGGSVRGCEGRGKAKETYAEGLQVIHGDGIAVEVEEGIQEHAAMPVTERRCVSALVIGSLPSNPSRNLRKNEAIPVEPLGVLGVELHDPVEKHVGDGRHAPGLG
jgi:hypothetical protein